MMLAVHKTVKPSPLSNRGYEHSEHPRMQTSPSTAHTPTECPKQPDSRRPHQGRIILASPLMPQVLAALVPTVTERRPRCGHAAPTVHLHVPQVLAALVPTVTERRPRCGHRGCRCLTLEASSFSNRGYEHSEHPRRRESPSTARTPTGCPTYISDVSLVILHTKLIQQSFKLIASRDVGMVCFLVDDVLSHPFFVSIGVGQSTIPVLPTLESRKALRRSFHQIIGCNLQVVDKSRNGYRRMQ